MVDAHSQSSDDGRSDDSDGGVGLSDRQLSVRRRSMLDMVNRLHDTGVQLDLDLPMIAVIGSQSAGKSSLIESISGITLPRASGTCTRCPTECRLSRSNDPWQCEVTLRFLKDEKGESRTEKFGGVITDKADVEERLRRAQRAILNPSTPYRVFLEGEDKDPDTRQLTFSPNFVSLRISGNNLEDLSFVDLPGLIASVGKGGNPGDIALVRNLVISYISRPSCIILLTVACETDFENQQAHELAKEQDPDGKRTIGVLTKPDRIPSGEEETWIRYIRNDYETLENNWYCVKQPNSVSLKQGITWAEARKQEEDFFAGTLPWSSLDAIHQQYLRTANLTTRLSNILSNLISKCLPNLQGKIEDLLSKVQSDLGQLPKPPSGDPIAEVLQLVTAFSRDLAQLISGTADRDGLLQMIRPAQAQFRRSIKASAPNFCPYKSCDASEEDHRHVIQEPSFLDNKGPNERNTDNTDDDELQDLIPKRVMFVDEVHRKAQEARSRELPGNFPFVVKESLILESTELWHAPSYSLYNSIFHTLSDHVNAIVAKNFAGVGQAELQQRVTLLMNEHLKVCGDSALKYIHWLLSLESKPFTLNEHYFSDYKDKFLSYFKGSHTHIPIMARELPAPAEEPYYEAQHVPRAPINYGSDPLAEILSALPRLGYHGIREADLARLTPPNPYESALVIMAEVRAYFQVAYKRVTDNIPLAIDRELILGLNQQAVEHALLKGLHITGADAAQVCADLIREQPHIAGRRADLKRKLERLSNARRELLQLGS